MVPVPEGGARFSPDGNTCTLEMHDVAVVDQPALAGAGLGSNSGANELQDDLEIEWRALAL